MRKYDWKKIAVWLACLLFCVVVWAAAALIAAGVAQGKPTAHRAVAGGVGVHSMLYLDSPDSLVDRVFSESKALGASEIRVDIALVNVFTPTGTDWSGVDRLIWESHKYNLPILANIFTTPGAADYLAPPDNYTAYTWQVAAVAQHTAGTIHDFEAWNEPDGKWSFHGTSTDYGHVLAADYAAVHTVPGDRLLLGGMMVPSDTTFTDTALAVPGANFDVTNIHIRQCGMGSIGDLVRWWRAKYARAVWVTEMGYPADPAYQHCTNYQGGAQAQAKYDVDTINTMWNNGASKVFVSGRDLGTTGFAATEGIEHYTPFFRRPAWNAVKGLT